MRAPGFFPSAASAASFQGWAVLVELPQGAGGGEANAGVRLAEQLLDRADQRPSAGAEVADGVEQPDALVAAGARQGLAQCGDPRRAELVDQVVQVVEAGGVDLQEHVREVRDQLSRRYAELLQDLDCLLLLQPLGGSGEGCVNVDRLLGPAVDLPQSQGRPAASRRLAVAGQGFEFRDRGLGRRAESRQHLDRLVANERVAVVEVGDPCRERSIAEGRLRLGATGQRRAGEQQD